ncbi:ChaN family lipoprotein [Enterobacteriaceae bacterium H4N4]|uniref:ChaN family lipoprotein n=1 Tax=Silvania confinis TaxID=2926470 RepID=A0A9J6QRX7_9ENTR|nr:ChaN family lipoprotein [Silvania confinis]MCU6670981.1 ChaN family lipoprotein [Silvania confinis]
MSNRGNFFKPLVLSSFLLIAGCHSPPSATVSTRPLAVDCGCIQDAATGKVITQADLIVKLASAPVVIVGEEHTNERHHQIEQWLLQNLNKTRQQGSVLMEMISSDQQAAVDRVKAQSLAGTKISATRAAEAMRWKSGWPWDLYRDVVMTALEGPGPLLAANISREQVSALYKNPVFPAGAASSQPQVREALSAIIYLMHDGQIDGEQVTAMLAIQQQRDRFMAEQLKRAPRPALLIAGGYHAAKDIGVPLHLADLNAEPPVVVMLSTVGTKVSAKQADYIWSVPAEKQP